MIGSIVKKTAIKILGTKNERVLNRLQPMVERINHMEPEFQKLSDADLRSKTTHFKERVDRGENLDSLLPEAFAAVREASKRTLGERPFDVQLMGGIVLHEGKIAEMATGEGKTLVATLPAYLNALTSKGVHIITVNDYLAKRDRDWMGAIYQFLGLSVGVIVHEMDDLDRQKAYRADITYGTNNEFGFDYLRDHMKFSLDECVQRELHYGIVDEVDSILIDEARTPLIISGPVERSTHKFHELKGPVERLFQGQTRTINRTLSEAEELLREGEDYEAGIKLLQAKRGVPKHKHLLRILEDGKYRKLLDSVELDFFRDKNWDLLDKDLSFVIDEKSNVADLTERGRKVLSPQDPDFFVLPDLSSIDADPDLDPQERAQLRMKLEAEYSEKTEKIHNVSQLLRAYSLFERDVAYVVSNGQVVIVDEFTGRLMPGRRYSDGLHQALEAKEGVTIERENQTLATITFQNYFRMYEKLAGMTGTAYTEEMEFHKTYGLEVTVIPTNMPLIRTEYPDVIYKSEREKFNAVLRDISQLHGEGHPVLVGTVSVEKSERLSRLLKRNGIKHHVLNAKNHEREAEVIAQAGRKGAVTISTNMAGRGTDILLGGNPKFLAKAMVDDGASEKEERKAYERTRATAVKEKEEVLTHGGLHVIGTERHEARRIDNQLRGRAGRQGDPGSSRFYLSLEDDLMRLFGSERISTVMTKLGIEEDQPIEHNLITKAIENAQRRVEGHNFDIRKHLLEYDDVMNRQREEIYRRRREVLGNDNVSDRVMEMAEELVEEILDIHTDRKTYPEEWNLRGLQDELFRNFSIHFDIEEEKSDGLDQDALREQILDGVRKAYAIKEQELGQEIVRHLEKVILLQSIDTHWREHLLSIDYLKEGIGLRGYGQKDPLTEFRIEGSEMFLDMLAEIREDTIRQLFAIRLAAEREAKGRSRERPQRLVLTRGEMLSPPLEGEMPVMQDAPMAMPEAEGGKVVTFRREGRKIGRNEPCPCGSGRKYKKCCGR
ncbi:MAG: preprotein translocase subunit SecA [Syntrophobacterales bacterium]|nr:MAG: preprotein translocase subunit SecA [Syntrophobacterales bacterium]